MDRIKSARSSSPNVTRLQRLNAATGGDVWQLLRKRAERAPERPFFVWHPYEGTPSRWTYGEFTREAAALGAGLQARGVKPGDPVLVHLENSPEFLLSWFACAASGAVAVTTNARSAGDELAYYADHAGVVGAITQPRFASLVEKHARSLRWHVVTGHDAGVPSTDDAGADSFDALKLDPNELEHNEIHPLSALCVQYTSGTTSRPKGVVWTHANAVWGARQNALHVDLRPDDRQLVYMPLFHTNALAYSMLATLWVGSTFVLVPKWSTSRFWDLSTHYDLTFLAVSGLAHRSISSGGIPEKHSYQRFGFGFCEAFRGLLDVKTIGWFGMTETVSHPIIGNPFGPDRPMSMGRPAPEYGVAVVDTDGASVEPDQTGELAILGVPGVSLFSEYLRNPEATDRAYDDLGWFRTGDLVTPHVDGYITYASRSADLLRVGSENVSATEIERVILETGRVSEAAVVGRFDEKLDEVPVAFVIPRGSVEGLGESIIATCNERLAAFKVPRSVVVVRQLPRSTLFKVNKGALRRTVAEMHDVQELEEQWVLDALSDPSGDVN